MPEDDRMPASVLKAIPVDADVFTKASMLQLKAAEFGFDWPSIKPVFQKLTEEIAELKEEIGIAFDADSITEQHRHRMQDELGDVLFCCVNLARFMGVDAAQALHGTNEKFTRRFQFIENSLKLQGRNPDDLSLDELDALWNQAKKTGL